MLKLKLKRYIGDGVYAGFDGVHIWVWCDRDGHEHSVAFEPETMARLTEYVSQLKHMSHDPISMNQGEM